MLNGEEPNKDPVMSEERVSEVLGEPEKNRDRSDEDKGEEA